MITNVLPPFLWFTVYFQCTASNLMTMGECLGGDIQILMQNYKSLCAAFVISDTLLNRQAQC